MHTDKKHVQVTEHAEKGNENNRLHTSLQQCRVVT